MKTPSIRPKAVCLFRHNDNILVSEAYDSVKGDYFWGPLGGGIEFGEYGRDAIRREMREEIGAEIEDVTWLATLENIFTCEGQPGHEIVLVYDARFVNRSLYDCPAIQGFEEGAPDEHFIAVWKSVEELAAGDIRLVPEGLLPFLLRLAVEPG